MNATTVPDGLVGTIGSFDETLQQLEEQHGPINVLTDLLHLACTALQDSRLLGDFFLHQCLRRAVLARELPPVEDCCNLTSVLRRLSQTQAPAALARALKEHATRAEELEHLPVAVTLLQALSGIVDVPERPWAYERLAVILQKQGDLRGAETACRRAVQFTCLDQPEERYRRLELLLAIVEVAHKADPNILQAREHVLRREVECAECMGATRLAVALGHLADLLHDNKRFAEADGLYVRALDLMYRMHGERYEPSYPLIANLSGCRIQLGDEEAQRKLYSYFAALSRMPHMAIRPDEYLVEVRANDSAIALSNANPGLEPAPTPTAPRHGHH